MTTAPTVSLVHDALVRARGDVRAAAVLLDEAAASARSRLRTLASSWHGVAAEAFTDAFADWERAAAAGVDDLRRLDDGLATAYALLGAADGEAAGRAALLRAGVLP